MVEITDSTKAITHSYFKLVFFRKTKHSKEIGILDWIKLTTLEILFGEELLEQLTLTSAYNNLSANQKTGHMLHLSDMVPSGFLTNYLRKQIVRLLYLKYYKIYLFLASESAVEEHNSSVDLTRVRFAMRHDLLYQVIAFRRVYIISWVFINFGIDFVVYLSADLQSALLSALSIEAIRRLTRF